MTKLDAAHAKKNPWVMKKFIAIYKKIYLNVDILTSMSARRACIHNNNFYSEALQEEAISLGGTCLTEQYAYVRARNKEYIAHCYLKLAEKHSPWKFWLGYFCLALICWPLTVCVCRIGNKGNGGGMVQRDDEFDAFAETA